MVMQSRPLTVEVANDVALQAMMASNAYVGDPTRTRFPINTLAWRKVDLEGRPLDKEVNSYSPVCIGNIFSSLQFDIWESATTAHTIFAFKGSEELADWIMANLALVISLPYKSAKKHVREYRDRFPMRTVSLTGHSLGGGIALSVSVWEGLDAVVFDSSPRVFDGMGDHNEPALRRAVFEQGDPLEHIRASYPKFLEKISPGGLFETNFDFHGASKHRMDLLAEGILRMSNRPLYVEMASKLKLHTVTSEGTTSRSQPA